MAGGGWIDVAPLLPSALSSADVDALMERLPQLSGSGVATGTKSKELTGRGTKSSAAVGSTAAGGGGAELVASTCVVSGVLMARMSDHVVSVARQAAEKALHERRTPRPAAGNQPSAATSTGAQTAQVRRLNLGCRMDGCMDACMLLFIVV